jgi:hypothetical protein
MHFQFMLVLGGQGGPNMVGNVMSDDLYGRMHNWDARHVGIDEALDMIREDTELQQFLRNYALKNGLYMESDLRYFAGPDKYPYVNISGSKDNGLALGLDPYQEYAGYIFRYGYPDEDGDPGYWIAPVKRVTMAGIIY